MFENGLLTWLCLKCLRLSLLKRRSMQRYQTNTSKLKSGECLSKTPISAVEYWDIPTIILCNNGLPFGGVNSNIIFIRSTRYCNTKMTTYTMIRGNAWD